MIKLRHCSRLRSLPLLSRHPLSPPSPSPSPHRLLHHQSSLPLLFSSFTRLPFSHFNAPSSLSSPPTFPLHSFLSPPLPPSLVHVRCVSSREKKKRRKPMTPVTSKIKKFKLKFYSSYKSRFRALNDGTIRRWKEGKRHNAHLKSKKSKRRLRKPAIVPPAYAKVMKKLNFFA